MLCVEREYCDSGNMPDILFDSL